MQPAGNLELQAPATSTERDDRTVAWQLWRRLMKWKSFSLMVQAPIVNKHQTGNGSILSPSRPRNHCQPHRRHHAHRPRCATSCASRQNAAPRDPYPENWPPVWHTASPIAISARIPNGAHWSLESRVSNPESWTSFQHLNERPRLAMRPHRSPRPSRLGLDLR